MEVGYNFGIHYNYRKHHYCHENIMRIETALAAKTQHTYRAMFFLVLLTREHTHVELQLLQTLLTR